jgi:hypothetical protein
VPGAYLPTYDGGDRHAVEAVAERAPDFDGVATLALVVEAVDPVDRRALVVAPQEEELLRVLDLVGEEQADGLDALHGAVDVVPQEEIPALVREAAHLEQPKQVRVLAVRVAANVDRSWRFDERRLFQEDLYEQQMEE